MDLKWIPGKVNMFSPCALKQSSILNKKTLTPKQTLPCICYA